MKKKKPVSSNYFTFEDSHETKSSSYLDREERPAYLYKSGAIYTGQWRGKNRDGYGVQTWPDGAKYEGQ